MKLFILIFLLLNCSHAFSEESKTKDEHAEEGHKTEEKHEEAETPAGIVSFDDEKEEFVLKPNVINNFGIISAPLVIENKFIKIPSSAVVKSLNVLKVFLKKENTFRALEIKVLKSEGAVSYIGANPELSSYQIVIKGTNFLQTIMLSLEEGPSEGHGH